MSDVLSQSQIDELLKNLNNADSEALENISDRIAEEKIKAYDFKVPKKFTKEQVKIIHNIYESFSRLFSSYLTGLTRFYCKARVLQIEEQRYYEFNNALPDYTMMGNINLSFNEQDDIMNTKCIIQFSNFVSFSLIDRMLGGYGNNMDVARDFTDIEIKLMQGIFEKMSSMMSEVFSGYAETNAEFISVETNARINQVISAEEVIVLVTLEVEYNDVKNIVTITMPAMAMESLISQMTKNMTKNVKVSDNSRESERRNGIMKKISGSTFKLDAVLAETKINLDEILSLQPDDILLLNVPITQNISLKMNDKKLFDGKLGIINHKKAVKVSNIYNNLRR